MRRGILVFFWLLGCGGGDDEAPPALDTAVTPEADVVLLPPLTSAEVAAAGPYAAGTFDVSLTDVTRPIAPTDTFPGADARAVAVTVWYPAVGAAGSEAATDAAAATGGPFPVLVYSHGFMSNAGENASLLSWLATHGVITLAPTFPRTNGNAEGGADILDAVNQPGDITLALGWLEAANQDSSHRLHGEVDISRVVSAGMSLGGLTSALVGFFPKLKDKRITAVASMAGPLCLLPDSVYPHDGRPLFLLYGRGDAIAPYEANGPKAYAAAAAPKWLVSVEGGTHLGFASAAADVFAGVADPDGIGCATLEKALAGKDLADIVTDLGFAPGETDASSCPSPCSAPAQGTKLSTDQQAALLPLTLGAFVRYAVTQDPRLAEFLATTLAKEHGEVTVEASP